MFTNKEKTILGFIITAIVCFIIGLNIGIEGQKKFEKNLDERFTKPLFDQMQADYQNVVSQWKECRDELFEYRKVTGFMKPAEYDSLNKLKTQLIREKMDAVEQAYIAASNAKAIEEAIKQMNKKTSE
jgi:hypothetical protein